jgi:hypothetical protein
MACLLARLSTPVLASLGALGGVALVWALVIPLYLPKAGRRNCVKGLLFLLKNGSEKTRREAARIAQK